MRAHERAESAGRDRVITGLILVFIAIEALFLIGSGLWL